MGGGFRRSEVTVTRLGQSSPRALAAPAFSELTVCSPDAFVAAEETEHLIGLASDWLELDSPDEGIRFDSELVRRHRILAPSPTSLCADTPPLLPPGPPARDRAGQLPQHPGRRPPAAAQPGVRRRLRPRGQQRPRLGLVLHADLDPDPHLGPGRARQPPARRARERRLAPVPRRQRPPERRPRRPDGPERDVGDLGRDPDRVRVQPQAQPE